MESNYKRLGDYITEVDVKNTESAISKLVGISISKKFIDSVANIVGTDLSKYKIIKKGQFACNLMHVGRDGGIAISLYKEDGPAIMSTSCFIFEVNSKDILPEYLELIFNNPEFDREAVFYANCGVRATLTWDDFCEMEIKVPNKDFQHKKILITNIINNRKLLLEKLIEKNNEFLRIVCNKLVECGGYVERPLSEVCTMEYGYTASASINDIGPHYIRITDITSGIIEWNSVPYCLIPDSKLERYLLEDGDTLIARIGSVGSAKLIVGKIPNSVFASYLVRVKPIDERYKYYFGIEITSDNFYNFVCDAAEGSVQYQANPPLLGKYIIKIPSTDTAELINKKISPLLLLNSKFELELNFLNELKRYIIYDTTHKNHK